MDIDIHQVPQVEPGTNAGGAKCPAVATWPSTGNHLLRVLSENELARHGRAVTQIMLTHGQKLFVSCEPLSHVYFPITCVASRLNAAQCGHFAEMGMVGFEGVVGLSVFLGAKAAANNAVVHVEGIALRMEAAAAKAMFQQHPLFGQLCCATCVR